MIRTDGRPTVAWMSESDMEDGMRTSGSGRVCPECGVDVRFADHEDDCPDNDNEQEG